MRYSHTHPKKKGRGVNSPTPVDQTHPYRVVDEVQLWIVDLSMPSLMTRVARQMQNGLSSIPLGHNVMLGGISALAYGLATEEARIA